ncbi:hypothetical protein [Halobacterium zhouii]|uniref:hypothetical protein n=1 Tax=Halobacterium zhouii TaxID=2902624 RepID=UPI001E57BAEA|nr:hypothetical protein [Halobacterium zhouii]
MSFLARVEALRASRSLWEPTSQKATLKTSRERSALAVNSTLRALMLVPTATAGTFQ